MSHRVLETDFPLMPPPNPPTVMHRSYSRDRSQHNSLSRPTTTAPTAAPTSTEWAYNNRRMSGTEIHRTGSLRKAYSESSEEDNGNSSRPEMEPLYPQRGRPTSVGGATASAGVRASMGVSTDAVSGRPSPQRSDRSSTSDYHSDNVNQQRTASQHLGKPIAENLKKQTMRRHRKHDDDSMSGGARCCFGLLVIVAQILLNGVMGLCLYWVIQYRSDEDGGVFAWRANPKLEFNLHPVLMTAGFIYFMGQAMLMYRSCRCCHRIWNKLLHTLFHILAIPCIAIGFVAVLDSHNLRTVNDQPAPIPNFYSLHSWIGLTAMGLFALQFVVGFFSFILLLCCESATASFRASLVPIHATFGISTFVLAVAAACSGLTEKAFFSLSIAYTKWVPYLFDPNFNRTQALNNNLPKPYTSDTFEESLIVNVLGISMILLAVVIPLIVSQPRFRYRPQRVVTVTHDRYG